MDAIYLIPVIIIVLVLGVAAGFFTRTAIMARRFHHAEEDVAKLLDEAATKQKEILLEAKEEALRIKADIEAEMRSRRSELHRQERRISQKEENLDRKTDALEKRERSLGNKEKEIEKSLAQLDEFKKKQVHQLELISGMSTTEAKDMLLTTVEEETRQDMAQRIRDVEAQLKEESDQKAREIVAFAIQRCSSDVASETTVSVVSLPSDDMKGRLIGREGRNIRALENATGVDLIVDDTPEAVTISCFDPIRREVARLALERLIIDGRIHPARIEEVVGKAKDEVDAIIQTEGEQAAYKAGVVGLHPEIIKLLGRLKYRFSYGQNVLTHSVEVSHLSAMIASEVGADINIAKTAGLLHDIGKAVDQEIEGTHAAIGADITKRLGKSLEVSKAIAGHHGETDSVGVYGFIVSAADAISSSRPGARRESLEQHLKRLEALETVASSFPGVEKSFAIQAGREVRIMVKPQDVDDLTIATLARDIVKQIEENLEYPGQIKVTVIRETRAIDYAK
ncbi:MAG: ribonuclease Y [Dehalococcoidia bacterium]|nr:MAG: ribonuclease Y [Dehalococcoidia bacterium]